jgi:hypothetical protein
MGASRTERSVFRDCVALSYLLPTLSMDPQVLAQFGPYSITMGMITAAVVELAKRLPNVPLWKGQKWRIRCTVAVLALLTSLAGAWWMQQPIEWSLLLPMLIQYLTATATYDHAFSQHAPAENPVQ